MRYGTDAPEVESERRAARKARRPAKPSAGRRLSEAKREERERRQRAFRTRRVLLIVALVAAVALVCWGVFALSRAPIFTIENVQVSGAHHYKPADIERIARVPEGSTLIRLPAADIEKRLEEDPWIIDAELDRDFPSTLRIALSERRPVALVDAGADKLWLASADGYWLGIRAEGQDPLPVVQDVAKITPRAGSSIREPEVRNAIGVIDGLSDKLRERIVSVSAASVDETAVRTRKDVEIFVGQATSMGEKSRIISEILAEHDGVVYINVRVTDRPTWRGLESE